MIKIERKETPHTQEAMDDLQEACDTGRSYNTEHVNQALQEVFHGKCYICENKEATSYQIEHLIPHRGDKKLKYDWNNLFWVCAHCNNIKSDKYEPILNCTTEPVEHLIAFRKTGYFGTDEKEDIAMLLKRELKDSSAFTAFKRWLIWDNEEKYGELEKFIPENQKKKLFYI